MQLVTDSYVTSAFVGLHVAEIHHVTILWMLLYSSPTPAFCSSLQTVPVAQMTQMAKPLPKQEYIDKGKVWTIFIGGAASLFAITVAAENNKSWFPAIARANEAMAIARKRAAEVRA